MTFVPHRLELRNVHAGYGRIEVLRELDICVPAGAIVALLGPNGAGKSTTLKAIAGTVAVRHGDVLLEGRPITALSSYQRARRGVMLVPEGRGVFPSLTGRGNLELVARA